MGFYFHVDCNYTKQVFDMLKAIANVYVIGLYDMYDNGYSS